MKIAIFDVCDTLYSTNTTFSFLDYYFNKNKKYLFFRKLTKLFIVKATNYLIYKYTKKDFIRLYATTFLKDKDIEIIKKYSQKFVKEYLVDKIKKDISLMLREYKNKNYKIVLISGSYDFIIKEVSNYFNADYFYASKLKLNNNHYIGKYDKDILLTKYELVQKEFSNIEHLVVVSDNKSDLILMQSADEAYAVCNTNKDYSFWYSYINIVRIKDF